MKAAYKNTKFTQGWIFDKLRTDKSLANSYSVATKNLVTIM